MPKQSLARIAVIAAAHGIRGEVKLRSFANPPEAIFSYKNLSDATGTRPFALTKRGIQGELFITAIDGVTDRNEAELLKGKELYIPASALPASEKGVWSYGELTGLTAMLPDGSVYGKIVQLYNFGAGDIVEIEKANGETEMLPLKEPFVSDVKPEEGYIVVHPPEYVESGEEK